MAIDTLVAQCDSLIAKWFSVECVPPLPLGSDREAGPSPMLLSLISPADAIDYPYRKD